MKSKKNSQRQRFVIAYGLLGITLLCIALLFLLIPEWGSRETEIPREEQERETEVAAPETIPDSKEDAIEQPATFPVEKMAIPLAIVLDDVGNNLEALQLYLDLDFPLTFAILPMRTYTAECEEAIRSAGKETILHLPMEAIGREDPGPGAVFTNQTENEIKNILRINVQNLPHIVGVNNHMGSKATEDLRIMREVFGFLKERDIFFLDSVTSPDSVAAEAADELGVPYLYRNMPFLDNDVDEGTIREMLLSNLKRAEKDGYGIMIGHVTHEELARVLAEELNLLPEDEYRIVSLSEMLEILSAEESAP